jgi:hypothetical protein
MSAGMALPGRTREFGRCPSVACPISTRTSLVDPGCVETRWHYNAKRDADPSGAFDCLRSYHDADEGERL